MMTGVNFIGDLQCRHMSTVVMVTFSKGNGETILATSSSCHDQAYWLYGGQSGHGTRWSSQSTNALKNDARPSSSEQGRAGHCVWWSSTFVEKKNQKQRSPKCTSHRVTSRHYPYFTQDVTTNNSLYIYIYYAIQVCTMYT